MAEPSGASAIGAGRGSCPGNSDGRIVPHWRYTAAVHNPATTLNNPTQPCDASFPHIIWMCCL